MVREAAIENGPDFVKTYDAAVAQVGASGFEVMTFGDASLNEEINRITEEDIARGESIGAIIAFVILIVVFGALVAAFVPIILAAFPVRVRVRRRRLEEGRGGAEIGQCPQHHREPA